MTPAVALTLCVSIAQSDLNSLIRELGDENYSVRERATRVLLERGREAIPAIQAAAAAHDPEIQARSRLLLKRIDVPSVQVVLCRSIRGWRDFDPVQSAVFDVRDHALLYVEVDRPAVREVDGVRFVHLRYDWRLYDAAGKDVTPDAWLHAPADAREDRRSVRLRCPAFFQTFRLPIPLYRDGEYSLRVIVHDLNAPGRTEAADVSIGIEEKF